MARSCSLCDGPFELRQALAYNDTHLHCYVRWLQGQVPPPSDEVLAALNLGPPGGDG